MSEQVITVQRREQTGINASRRVRSAGLIPAVVYGAGRDSVSISVDRKTVLELLRKEGSDNAVFLLKLEDTGKERHAMIRDLQVNPTTREIVHIDFLRLVMDQPVRVTVAVELIGTPLGVKQDDGVLDFVTRELEVECLPGDIPQKIEADVSGLHIGQHLEASQLDLPAKVQLLDEATRVIASVTAPRRIEEAEEEDEFLLEAESAEPEVIGRGKEGAEEEEG